MMDQKRAMDILLAYACCNSNNKCDDCPWNKTEDCENTSFLSVLDDAVNVILNSRKQVKHGNT